MLEPLLSFTVVTVTALGGALGTGERRGTAFISAQQHPYSERDEWNRCLTNACRYFAFQHTDTPCQHSTDSAIQNKVNIDTGN